MKLILLCAVLFVGSAVAAENFSEDAETLVEVQELEKNALVDDKGHKPCDGKDDDDINSKSKDDCDDDDDDDGDNDDDDNDDDDNDYSHASSAEKDESLSVGAIVGIAMGCLIVLVFLATCIVLTCTKSSPKTPNQNQTMVYCPEPSNYNQQPLPGKCSNTFADPPPPYNPQAEKEAPPPAYNEV